MTPSTVRKKRPPARLLWVASEATPYAGTGGLAEVTGTLPLWLRGRGWDVQLMLPAYRGVRETTGGLRITRRDSLTVPLGRRELAVEILRAQMRSGISLLLLSCDELYGRPGIYGERGWDYPDNHLRFGVLSLAALEVIRRKLIRCDLLHLHDWQAAPAAVFLKTRYRDDPVLAGLRTVLTIHNMAYQGRFPAAALDDLGLPPVLAGRDWLGDADGINLLKGGILCADRLTTVSPRHASEILTASGGFGLEKLLRSRRAELTGILNGIDTREWNPATDPRLPSRYSAGRIRGKAACKRGLQEELGLEIDPRRPVVGFVGRLVEQKGVDLLLDALPSILRRDGQVAVLGAGDAGLEERLRDAAAAHPGRVAVIIGYRRELVSRILAGCDLFVMPSRFEPCGIGQMQAMRYGTLPVVHATGGLKDTVEGVSSASLKAGRGNGFVFHKLSARALALALGKAMDLYGSKADWSRIVHRAMKEDRSWRAAVTRYGGLYRDLAQSSPRRLPVPAELAAEEPAAGPSPLPRPGAAGIYLDWGPDLPPRYGRDTIRLMAQSPWHLYLYWELSPDRYQALGGRPKLSLRLWRGNRSTVAAGGRSDLGDWWFTVEPDESYLAELLAPDESVLLESATVRTPPAGESPRFDVRWFERERRLRRLEIPAAEAVAPSFETSLGFYPPADHRDKEGGS